MMSGGLTGGKGGPSRCEIDPKLAQWLTLSIYSSSLWFFRLLCHPLSTLTRVFDQPARNYTA